MLSGQLAPNAIKAFCHRIKAFSRMTAVAMFSPVIALVLWRRQPGFLRSKKKQPFLRYELSSLLKGMNETREAGKIPASLLSGEIRRNPWGSGAIQVTR